MHTSLKNIPAPDLKIVLIRFVQRLTRHKSLLPIGGEVSRIISKSELRRLLNKKKSKPNAVLKSLAALTSDLSPLNPVDSEPILPLVCDLVVTLLTHSQDLMHTDLLRLICYGNCAEIARSLVSLEFILRLRVISLQLRFGHVGKLLSQLKTEGKIDLNVILDATYDLFRTLGEGMKICRDLDRETQMQLREAGSMAFLFSNSLQKELFEENFAVRFKQKITPLFEGAVPDFEEFLANFR